MSAIPDDAYYDEPLTDEQLRAALADALRLALITGDQSGTAPDGVGENVFAKLPDPLDRSR